MCTAALQVPVSRRRSWKCRRKTRLPGAAFALTSGLNSGARPSLVTPRSACSGFLLELNAGTPKKNKSCSSERSWRPRLRSVFCRLSFLPCVCPAPPQFCSDCTGVGICGQRSGVWPLCLSSRPSHTQNVDPRWNASASLDFRRARSLRARRRLSWVLP